MVERKERAAEGEWPTAKWEFLTAAIQQTQEQFPAPAFFIWLCTFRGFWRFRETLDGINNFCKTFLHSTKLWKTMLLLNSESHLRLIVSVLLNSNLAHEFLWCLSLVFGFFGCRESFRYSWPVRKWVQLFPSGLAQLSTMAPTEDLQSVQWVFPETVLGRNLLPSNPLL